MLHGSHAAIPVNAVCALLQVWIAPLYNALAQGSVLLLAVLSCQQLLSVFIQASFFQTFCGAFVQQLLRGVDFLRHVAWLLQQD